MIGFDPTPHTYTNPNAGFIFRFIGNTMDKTNIAILLLLIGTLIYILFRPDVLFLEPLWDILGKKPYPIINNVDDSTCGKILIYSLPDALWYAALLLIQKKILQNNPPSKIIYGFSIALPFVLEFLQGLHLISGTFDLIDLSCYLATLVLIVCIPDIYHNYSSWMNAIQLLLLSSFILTALACDHNLVRRPEAHNHHIPHVRTTHHLGHHKSCPYYHEYSDNAYKLCPICHGNWRRYNPPYKQ